MKHNLRRRSVAFTCGALVQGLLLGLALTIALLKLMELGSDAKVFRYQGF